MRCLAWIAKWGTRISAFAALLLIALWIRSDYVLDYLTIHDWGFRNNGNPETVIHLGSVNGYLYCDHQFELAYDENGNVVKGFADWQPINAKHESYPVPPPMGLIPDELKSKLGTFPIAFHSNFYCGKSVYKGGLFPDDVRIWNEHVRVCPIWAPLALSLVLPLAAMLVRLIRHKRNTPSRGFAEPGHLFRVATRSSLRLAGGVFSLLVLIVVGLLIAGWSVSHSSTLHFYHDTTWNEPAALGITTSKTWDIAIAKGDLFLSSQITTFDPGGSPVRISETDWGYTYRRDPKSYAVPLQFAWLSPPSEFLGMYWKSEVQLFDAAANRLPYYHNSAIKMPVWVAIMILLLIPAGYI